MNIDELFQILEEKAGRLTLDPQLKATIFFDLTAPEPAQWHGRVEDGRASLSRGPAPEPADISVSASGENAIALYEKRLKPMMAFMTGKIKIKGDPTKIALVKSLLGAK